MTVIVFCMYCDEPIEFEIVESLGFIEVYVAECERCAESYPYNLPTLH